MRGPMPFLTTACLFAASAYGQSAPASSTASSPDQTDVAAIQQLEDQWLKTERNTDVAMLDGSWPTISQESAATGPRPAKLSS